MELSEVQRGWPIWPERPVLISVLHELNASMISLHYRNNNETYYSTIIVMIPTQRTKIIAVRGTVSQHYCKR